MTDAPSYITHVEISSVVEMKTLRRMLYQISLEDLLANKGESRIKHIVELCDLIQDKGFKVGPLLKDVMRAIEVKLSGGSDEDWVMKNTSLGRPKREKIVRPSNKSGDPKLRGWDPF